MNKFPKSADVVAACFLMMVCLWAGSEVGKAECQRMEVKK